MAMRGRWDNVSTPEAMMMLMAIHNGDSNGNNDGEDHDNDGKDDNNGKNGNNGGGSIPA
jgi:hypothetical protein